MKNKKIRALVFSGGGSKGAFLGGEFQALVESGLDWDLYVGCSTGSILNTLAPMGDYETLKKAYTSVNQKSIFPKINPFTKKGKINIWNAMWRLIKGKNSLGEGDGLIELLKQYYTVEDFNEIKDAGRKVFNCCTNMTKGQVDYFCNMDIMYDTYMKTVLASASVPLGFDLVEINGDQYLDGGLMEHVPIQKAIDEGATEIDVLISRPKVYPVEEWKADGMWSVLMRTIDLMEREVSYSDVMIANLLAKDKDVKLNIYYTPRVLTDNSLIFNEVIMSAWWSEGYEYAKKAKCETIILKSKKAK